MWGLGGHAFKTVLPALAASRCLAGVYSRNPDSRQRAEREYGCPSWTTEDAILADAGVDAIYLATPVGTHFEQGSKVLASGRDLLCEKSLTDEHAKSQALVALARQRGLVLCETFIYQFHPRLRALVDMVRAGELGRITTVTCGFHLPNLVAPGYRTDPALGGGAFLDVACYPLSLLVALGCSEPVVADARFIRAPGATVDTAGVARVAWEETSQALLSWGYGAAYRNEATLIGEKMSVTIEGVFAKGGAPCTELFVRNAQGVRDLRHFQEADGTREMLAYAMDARFNPAMKEALWLRTEQQAGLMHQLRRRALG